MAEDSMFLPAVRRAAAMIEPMGVTEKTCWVAVARMVIVALALALAESVPRGVSGNMAA